ncbi:hypothetical protein Tco_0335351, partial [Tanacetum coccineum]
DLSSNVPLVGAAENECLLGETSGGVLVGDADADKVRGVSGGVSQGELAWDANKRLCDIRGLDADKIAKRLA